MNDDGTFSAKDDGKHNWSNDDSSDESDDSDDSDDDTELWAAPTQLSKGGYSHRRRWGWGRR